MFCFLCHFVWSGNSLWRRGYRLWMLEGMAKERAGGCEAPTVAFLAPKGSEGLWELQFAIWYCKNRRGCWILAGVFFQVVKNCVWIPLLRSSLVWSPSETMEALQLCQHSCTSFCWCSSSVCSLRIDQGVSPHNGVLKTASGQCVVVLTLSRASGSLGRKCEAKRYPRWCLCTRKWWSWIPAMGGRCGSSHRKKSFLKSQEA